MKKLIKYGLSILLPTAIVVGARMQNPNLLGGEQGWMIAVLIGAGIGLMGVATYHVLDMFMD